MDPWKAAGESMDRTVADELLELIKAEPEHLIVLPTDVMTGRSIWRRRLPAAWIICHASIDEAGEYDLRPVAEVIGPGQRLRFNQYRNPLVNMRKERQ